MSVLHIAQKNSIAKQVANVLSNGTKRTVPTLSQYNPIFQFQLQNKKHSFSSVRGHIFNHQLPQQCKYWASYDNRKILFPNQVPMVQILGPEMQSLHKNLQKLARKNKQLVLWLDCDRQGQAISFEVIQIIKKVNPNIKIKRARFAAVTPTDVWNAYNNLVQPNKLEADAVSYRTQIDFRTGCAFTRYQTVTFKNYFKALNNLVLSYGPCQIPTLNFVVQRYLQIKNFKPQKYFFIQMSCIIDQNTAIPFSWQKKNTRDQKQANQILAKILSSPDGQVYGKVISRKKIDKKKNRPFPLTTVKFQKLATDKLRFSSAKAMQLAQKLYQKGLISYPRTQTNAFPKTINLKSIIGRLNDTQYSNYVNKLLNEGKFYSPKSGNQNDQAHTPIHTVKSANRNTLTSQQWKIYDLITRSFLACCSTDAFGQQYQVKAQIQGQPFKASYLTIKDYGYLQIYPFEKWVQTSFPENIPDKFPAVIDLKNDKTHPPSYLSESNLIDLMQKNQIGTDATIHQHIQNIQKRNYASKSNNTLKPTNLGASLIQAYNQLQINLPKPQIRRDMQIMMNSISNGQINKDLAVKKTLDIMVPVYDKLQSLKQLWIETINKYIQLNKDLHQIQISEKQQGQNQNQQIRNRIVGGKCQKCNSDAYVRYSQKNKSYFIGCSKYPECKWIKSVPNYVGKVQQSNNVCQKCQNKKLILHLKQNSIPNTNILKLKFQQGQNKIQTCLLTDCDKDFYQSINQNSQYNYFARQNTISRPQVQMNQNSIRGNNQAISNKEVYCFKCKQPGHIAPVCPKKQVSNNTTKCYICNKTGHFANQCPTKNINNNNKNKEIKKVQNKNNNFKKQQNKSKIICFKCRQQGHLATHCNQQTKNSAFCNICEQLGHYSTTCPKKIKKAKQTQKKCNQCGVQGRHPKGSNCPSIKRK